MCNYTYTYSIPWISSCYSILSLASPFAHFPCIYHPFTYLEIPLLVIVVRMSIHTGPWLVTDCPPLASYPPPPLPTAPTVHVTCFQRRHHNISHTVWYNKVGPKCINCVLWGWWHFISSEVFSNFLEFNIYSRCETSEIIIIHIKPIKAENHFFIQTLLKL